ncbi:hypothetical protein [Breznakia pachnodae]|uniref:Uncharacterized protein n=1 Tax=Breznakia pachnodae TaxID=265178 RepID=A0ABU0E347_9FIRM|nr:hypothetical protein [Breznakia pachnodae]MDQ0361317.1 hypothetical protein [Breznakia pachnodae]
MDCTITKETIFPIRIELFNNTAIQDFYVFNTRESNCYIVDKDINVISEITFPYKRVGNTAIHKNGELIYISGDDNKLHLYNQSGDEIKNVDGSYIGLYYKDYLYAIRRIDDNHLSIEVFDDNLTSLFTKTIEDELYRSDVSLGTVPNSNEIILELMAGQDGCILYFICYENNDISMKRLRNECYVCPTFNNNDSTKFVCIDNDDLTINLFDKTSLNKISTYSFDEDSDFGYSLAFIDDTHLIIQQDESYFNLDTTTMKIESELTTKNNSSINISDMSYFCLYGKAIVGYFDHEEGCKIAIINIQE